MERHPPLGIARMIAESELLEGARRMEVQMRASLYGMLFVSALGCGTSPEEGANDGESSSTAPAYQRGATPTVQGPSLEADVAAVTGPGCPNAASWNLEEVPEGNAFTLTFNALALEVVPAQAPITKEIYCDLSLNIGSSRPVSYAIASFQYFGYAYLRDGMSGALDVRYGFAGNATAAAQTTELRYDLKPPVEGSFAYDDNVQADQGATWSRCAGATPLRIRLRLSLTSTNREWPGLLTLSNVDRRSAEVRINFDARNCASSDVSVTRR